MSENDETAKPNLASLSKNEAETLKNTKSVSVVLTTENVSFTVARSLLTNNSEYFKAMLDGNFKEANQRQIFLQSITADALECILNFFNFNTVEIPNLNIVGDLFHAANYFGLDSFHQRVEKKLIHFIEYETCFRIFQICKDYKLSSLESVIKSFILYSFNEIVDTVCQIGDINVLHWYLSHHNLYVENEMDVFNAGCQWLMIHSENNDDILIILSCLVYHKIDKLSIESMLSNGFVKNNEIAQSVLKGIIHIIETYSIESFLTLEHENDLREHFSDEIYEIIYGFLLCKKNRSPPVKPCILKRSSESIDIMTYDFNEKKLVQCLPLPGYSWWGHNIVSWKGFTVFMLFGKMKNNDTWNYDMKRYNCLTKTWEILTSKIPSPRRHATAIVHDDLLYVIGGFGQFRVMLNSVHVYNIKTENWSTLPDLPEYSSCLVASFHKGKLFVSGEYFYVLEQDRWHNLGALKTRHSSIFSHNNYLLFAKKWVKELYFWENELVHNEIKDNKIIKKCHYNVAGIIKIGNIVYIFSEGDSIDNSIAVEMCTLDDKLVENSTDITELLWLDSETDGAYHSLSGCFTLVDFNVTDDFVNKYGERWLL